MRRNKRKRNRRRNWTKALNVRKRKQPGRLRRIAARRLHRIALEAPKRFTNAMASGKGTPLLGQLKAAGRKLRLMDLLGMKGTNKASALVQAAAGHTKQQKGDR